MTEPGKKWIREQARFRGIFAHQDGKFEKKIPLSSVPIYEESKVYVNQVFESGFDGMQIRQFEKELERYMGLKHAVAVSSGEDALHLALKLAAEKLYGSSTGIYTPKGLGSGGCLQGKKVFCSDLITVDMVNPIVFEGGEPVFIDSSDSGLDWSISPEVLELAFQKYPETKIVVMNHAYGFPGEILKIRKLCFEQRALLIECAGEALGAACLAGQGEPDSGEGIWGKVGTLGDYTVLDFDKDKIIGGKGGTLLTRDHYEMEKARYWASGAKASTAWNQHEELGHTCTISELDAAMLRGQLEHIDEIVKKKKIIYERYYEKLNGEMAYVIDAPEGTNPNYWITAMTCESNIQFVETRDDRGYTYQDLHGTASPMEIYDVLDAFNVESRPIYKPMSMQPVYRNYEYFTLDGPWRMYESFHNDIFWLRCDMARQYFESGICLPSDVGMTEEEQNQVIDIIYACYDMADLNRLAWVK